MNLYIEEFKRHWHDVYASVESSIIKQISNTGKIDVRELNRILTRELSYWKNSFESKGKFINKIAEYSSEVSTTFKDAILGFTLKEFVADSKPEKESIKHSAVVAYGVGAVAGIAMAGIMQLLFHIIWLSAISGGVGLITTATILGNKAKDKHETNLASEKNDYLNQLNIKEASLIQILEKIPN